VEELLTDEAYAPVPYQREQSRLIRLSFLMTLASRGGEYVVPMTLKDRDVHLQQSDSIGGITSRLARCYQTIKPPFLSIVNLLRVDECIMKARKSGVIVFAHICVASVDWR
jgi:hypothetical protein